MVLFYTIRLESSFAKKSTFIKIKVNLQKLKFITNQDRSRGSTEFHNQNLRQISQGIPKLWSYTKTNRQTDKQIFIKERLLNEC